MTTTAFDDQFTDAPEPVRQQYSTADILRRNVADLELALRTQTERAEAAEAELAQARKQKPVAYVKYKATGGNVGLSWLAVPTEEFYPREGEPLYVNPVPAPAVPELDPMNRLIVSDPKQLKPKKQEPAVPADCRQRLRKEGKPYPRSSCAVCGKLSPNWRKCDALLQSEVTK